MNKNSHLKTSCLTMQEINRFKDKQVFVDICIWHLSLGRDDRWSYFWICSIKTRETQVEPNSSTIFSYTCVTIHHIRIRVASVNVCVCVWGNKYLLKDRGEKQFFILSE